MSLSKANGAERITGAAPVIDKENDTVARGREAWERLKNAKTWADWKLVGEALVIGRQEAMAEARTNKPRGKRYNKQFSGWLQSHGFDLDEGDRGKLLYLMERLPQVEDYLATLTPAKRTSLNHPSSVWRAFKCPDRGNSGKPPQGQGNGRQPHPGGGGGGSAQARKHAQILLEALEKVDVRPWGQQPGLAFIFVRVAAAATKAAATLEPSQADLLLPIAAAAAKVADTLDPHKADPKSAKPSKAA